MNKFHTRLSALLLTLLSFAVQALDTDRNQPIHIDSSSAHADYKSGTTRYDGNVVLTQGSLQIKADSISIQRDKNGVRAVTAVGRPVQIQQSPAADQAPIQAEANEISYDISTDQLILKDNVYIKLQESVHRGSRYEYNLNSQQLKASGTASSRISTTFQPQHPPKK